MTTNSLVTAEAISEVLLGAAEERWDADQIIDWFTTHLTSSADVGIFQHTLAVTHAQLLREAAGIPKGTEVLAMPINVSDPTGNTTPRYVQVITAAFAEDIDMVTALVRASLTAGPEVATREAMDMFLAVSKSLRAGMKRGLL